MKLKPEPHLINTLISSKIPTVLQGLNRWNIGLIIELLICINGAYGHRIAKICDYYGRAYLIQESSEDVPVNLEQLDRTLDGDNSITHVAAVFCETTSGLLNPLQEIADNQNVIIIEV